MKKFIALVLCLLLALTCLAACGDSETKDNNANNGDNAAADNGDNAETEGKLAAVKAAGKLVMATSPDFPPFENLEGTEIVGIEVDMLKTIAEKLGVELDMQTMDFDSVLTGVAAGKYDVGVSGITANEDRKKNMLFTDPYCMAAQAIVVVEGSPIASKADLEGKKISVQTGTTADTFCRESGYDVSSFAANPDAQLALVQGKVDAWVIDDLTAADMVATYNEANETKLVVLSEPMTVEPYGLAFAFGSEDLVEEINKIIAEMVEDGTVKGLFEKYNAPYTAPEK